MRRVFVFAVLYVSSVFALADVHDLRVWQSPDQVRLVLDLTSSHQHKVFQLTNPDRIVIDLEGADLKADLNSVKIEDTDISGLRSGRRNNHDLRLVVETKYKMPFKSFPLAANSSIKHPRLVIDLDRNVATEEPVVVKSVANYEDNQRDIIIAIDAGHGGEDPGAVSGKAKEKQVVLSIAKEVERLLKAETGYQPYMVRTGDYYIGLRERSEKARKADADFFVSIHADAFTRASANGSSVYVLSDRGASSETARVLADKENAADLIGGVSLGNREDHLAMTLLDLSMTYKRKSSVQIGSSILKEMGKISRLHKPSVEQAAFVVLKSPDMPALLVETGFISNPKERNKLVTKSYQKKMARAISTGIKNYFYEHPPAGTLVAARKKAASQYTEYVVKRGDTLSELAFANKTNIQVLRDINNLSSDALNIGQRLRIPGTL